MMSSNKPIKAGDEIFNTFGDLPRSELLRRYGYIDDAYIPYDVVEISTSKIIEIVRSRFKFTTQEIYSRTQGDCFGIRRKIERLIEAANSDEGDYQGTIFEDAYDIAEIPPRSGCFPLPLICTIWLLVAEDAEVETFKASRSPKLRMNLKVAWALRNAVADRQREYPYYIETDEQILEKADLPVRKRLAIEVRLGEQKILSAASKYFVNVEKKIPGGLANWRFNSASTIYLEGEEVVTDEDLEEGHDAKRRKLK